MTFATQDEIKGEGNSKKLSKRYKTTRKRKELLPFFLDTISDILTVEVYLDKKLDYLSDKDMRKLSLYSDKIGMDKSQVMNLLNEIEKFTLNYITMDEMPNFDENPTIGNLEKDVWYVLKVRANQAPAVE